MHMGLKNEAILVLDFGGQYSQLIARRVRENNVYCEIKSYKTPFNEILNGNYKGIIFSGGANSVYDSNSPKCDKKIFDLGIPILGICYGAQIMAYMLGGSVKGANISEYGNTTVDFNTSSKLFSGIAKSQNNTGEKIQNICWMSHNDYIASTPNGFKITASTNSCPIAAMENTNKKLFALQFHPEVNHTENGKIIIKNFLYNICNCCGDWIMSSFIEDTIKNIKEKVKNKKVLCALSGGVDSSVAAVITHKAIGNQLTCVFVDHGLLRKNEADNVEKIFKKEFNMNLIRVNAKDRFLKRLNGVTDPEKKRKIIGEEFIRVFEQEASKLDKVDFLCQGTIYPDVVESGNGESDVIKSHHNVGGLPDNINFEGIIEPLRNLFKDEVRNVGLELGISPKLVYRQPFPGPGLAVRIIGNITENKLSVLKEADAIFCEEIEKAGLNKKINQYFAVLTGINSVGVMGDGRTYDNTIALRAISTQDFMTAKWSHIDYEILEKISNRIVNEVKNVNRVVYDITSKPPATIEWE